MSVQVNLAKSIYPQDCVDAAVLAYANLCSVKVLRTTEAGCLVEITGVDQSNAIHEFLNYMLDLSLEKHLQPT